MTLITTLLDQQCGHCWSDFWEDPMPIHRTTQAGKPAYQWGSSGKKYTYTAKNKSSQMRAKKLAIKQGLAVARRTGKTPEL